METNRAVLDTNVLVRSFVHEADDALVWTDDVIEGRVAGIAPDLIHAELASAVTRYVRHGRLEFEAARGLLATAAEMPFELVASRDLSVAACELAIAHAITPYDAHYLALAEAEGAVLVTADRSLATAASRSVLLE